jgi:hypothetical protein
MSVKSQHKITHQQADGAVFLPFMKIQHAAVGGTLAFPIEAGQVLLAVIARCVTNVNGATPAVLVGDAADPDGFIAAADGIETAGQMVNSLAIANAYASGKAYTATNRLVVDFNDDATEGEIELLMLYSGKES